MFEAHDSPSWAPKNLIFCDTSKYTEIWKYFMKVFCQKVGQTFAWKVIAYWIPFMPGIGFLLHFWGKWAFSWFFSLTSRCKFALFFTLKIIRRGISKISVPTIGDVTVDISFGGMWYVVVSNFLGCDWSVEFNPELWLVENDNKFISRWKQINLD